MTQFPTDSICEHSTSISIQYNQYFKNVTSQYTVNQNYQHHFRLKTKINSGSSSVDHGIMLLCWCYVAKTVQTKNMSHMIKRFTKICVNLKIILEATVSCKTDIKGTIK